MGEAVRVAIETGLMPGGSVGTVGLIKPYYLDYPQRTPLPPFE